MTIDQKWFRKSMPGSWSTLTFEGKDYLVGIVMLEPKVAASIIEERNKENRKVPDSAVEKVLASMQSDGWQLTGQTLIFTGDGLLLDGQTRLKAFAKLGKPMPVFVAAGIDEKAFRMIDTGRTRRLSDILGMDKQPNPETLAGAICYLERFLRSGAVTKTSGGRVITTIQQWLDCLEANRGLIESVDFVKSNYHPRAISLPAWVAMHYIFTLAGDREQADAFVQAAVCGIVPDKAIRWQGVRLLHSRLVDNQTAVNSAGLNYTAALAVKAWGYFKRGEPCKIIRHTITDEFPKVEGWKYAAKKKAS